MMKVLCIVGTRPEAIKMAPVIRRLRDIPDLVETVVCATGQHRAILDQVLSVFKIRPDHDLNLMQHDQGLSGLLGDLFMQLPKVIDAFRPDWVLAQGDTSSVFVSAMTSFIHRTSFGHIEAGLRTGDRFRPFPEEMNRRLVAQLSTRHFAPTKSSRENLLREGIPENDIIVTGNTVVDALQYMSTLPFDWDASPLSVLPRARRFVVVTAHRRESFGAPLREICSAVGTLAREYQDIYQFVFPVHPNPNVQGPVYELLAGQPGITLLPPLDYMSMVRLYQNSALIMTDSGGIQEEAPTFGVPVIVLREMTERTEGIDAGIAILVGTSRSSIIQAAEQCLSSVYVSGLERTFENPYGDGLASDRIVRSLLNRSSEL